MMRHLAICFGFLLITATANAQLAPTYIDWIKPSQTYLQIKVPKNGVYRIPATSLAPYFPNLATLNAAGFQLYRRGKEQAILVNAGPDNLLTGSEYIDFMGLMNDATSEYEMYQKPMAAINEYRSLYDDTAHYFLTYTPDLNGKRVTNNGLNNNTSAPFETYAWRTAAKFQNTEYSTGSGLRGNVTFSSYFTSGEGWTGDKYSLGFSNLLTGEQANRIVIPGINNLYTTGPQPIVTVLEYGRQAVPHLIELLASSNNTYLDTFSFYGRSSKKFSTPLSANLIEGTSLQLRLHALKESNVSITYALLRYPATFDMPNGMINTELELLSNASGYSRLKLSNLGNQPEVYDFTDPLNPVRIGIASVGGQYIAGVENTTSPRKLCVQPQPFIVPSTGMEAMSFINFLPQNYDYILVSHSKLRVPTQGVNDPVEAYADYRRSIAGGSHKVLVLNMNEVYSRFGYGDRSPLSIRNLCGYFVQNQAKPKCLFLIGKGVNLPNRLSLNTVYANYYRNYNLVPTFGTPPSDNAYTVGLGEPGRTISFPVGRLAATEPGQVLTYLNKVKETEAFQYDDLWKKNMFHVSGGINGAEQAQFRSYVNYTANIARGKYMGAKVGIYNKISLNNVQPLDIRKVLNNGISMLMMFGHSSSTTSDVDIGYVSDPTQGINNAGKYPTVMVNGCFSGNIYEPNNSLNENWIFTPDKGAVVFWAASDEGLSALLGRHLQVFYNAAFADSVLFGKTIGEIQKEAMRRYMTQLSAEPQLDSSFMHQFTIHGDPMIKIFGGIKPDYKTSNSEIFLNSSNPSATDQSLKIGVIVSNFGRFSGDSLGIGVKRKLGNGEVITNFFQVRPVAYKDTFYLELPNLGATSFSGINRIEVFLDFLNREAELNDNNNIGVVEFFLPTAGILPLFPRDYSIVANRNIRFVVQASSLYTQDRKYSFQLDTSAAFNSPLLKQSPPILAGNLASWNTTLPLSTDSTVYYWRVRFLDQQSNLDTAWYRRSFEYIDNSPTGWAQSHFYQFRQSVDEGVVKDYVTRRWNYPSNSLNIDLKVSGGGKHSPKIWELRLNGISMLTGTTNSNCYNPGYARLCALHFDQNSLVPKFWNYFGDPYAIYNTGCGRLPLAVNFFQFHLPGQTYNTIDYWFKAYMKNLVPVGDYVLLFSMDSTFMETLADTNTMLMQHIGAHPDSISKIKNGNPFIFFGKRTQDPSPGQGEVILASPANGNVNDQVISFNKTITVNSTYGTITSTKIGPASQWGKLFNTMRKIETPVFDKYSLQVIGSSLTGKDSVLIDHVTSFPFDLSSISAEAFPYLTLKAFVKDSTYRTPALLKRWMVTYQGVPEGVINTSVFPSSEYKVGKLDEGDSLGFRFAFTNISDRDFADSVKVRYTQNDNYQIKNLGRLPKDSTVKFTIAKFSTLGKAGINSFQVFVNPRLQPEEYFENNVVEIPYEVRADKTNPLLDVTFDGVKIMNGDFVSPEPLISVALKDENKYLLKGDTSGLTMLVTKPCAGCQPERIPLNSPLVKIFPVGKDNLFRLEYRPGKLDNGNYRLAVQGTDVKGNESAGSSYQVDFQVINESTITNFYPYPNPFSTSCQWVFTMTGAAFPEDFKIQIMTVTGKVVREIFKSELGPLKIGNNVTQYRWNATDEFGDRLANGVYLYRVVMKEGSTFARRTTAADGTFTKGFGKLYIIR